MRARLSSSLSACIVAILLPRSGHAEDDPPKKEATDAGAMSAAEPEPPPESTSAAAARHGSPLETRKSEPDVLLRLAGNGAYRSTLRLDVEIFKRPIDERAKRARNSIDERAKRERNSIDERAKRARSSIASTLVFVEGQRDFFATDLGPPGKEALRLGSVLELYQLAFEVKGTLFPGRHQFLPDARSSLFLDFTGAYIAPVNPLKLDARLGLNADHADRWNTFVFAAVDQPVSASDFGATFDAGRLDLEAFGMIPVGESQYKASYQLVATYAVPQRLPFVLSGFNFLYGYAPDFGADTPYGSVGFSKGTEIARFRKGLWADHSLGVGWSAQARDVDLGFMTLPLVRTGFLYVWSPNDGFHGAKGSAKDLVPTAFDGGEGDLAFVFWWLDLGFDAGIRR